MHRTGYLRRGVGVAVGGAPIGLAVASRFSGMPCADWRRIVGVGLVLAAFGFALLNLYLASREGLYLLAYLVTRNWLFVLACYPWAGASTVVAVVAFLRRQ